MALSSGAKMLNRVAQGRLPFSDAVKWFESLPETDQLPWLQAIELMAHQAHPLREEVDGAITLAELKPTFTPCVMMLETDRPELVLHRVIALPPDERMKSFRLIFALYCIADTRRRQTDCRNGCTHEWHNFDKVDSPKADLPTPAKPSVNGEGRYARLQLTFAAIVLLILLSIYVPAEAKATSFHAFYGRLVHPWGNIGLTFAILSLCGLTLAITWSVFRAGPRIYRLGAFLISAVPLLIFVRYLDWVIRRLS